MNRNRSTVSIALTVFALLLFARPVAAGPQVPLKGTLQGSFTVIPVLPPEVNRHLIATGDATLLGTFTYDFPHTVDRSVTPSTGEGFATFTAANGDQVFAFVSGEATPIAPGVLQLTEVGEILGGTGRFANASGGFVVHRLIDAINLTTVGTFDGTISAPGAGR